MPGLGTSKLTRRVEEQPTFNEAAAWTATRRESERKDCKTGSPLLSRNYQLAGSIPARFDNFHNFKEAAAR